MRRLPARYDHYYISAPHQLNVAKTIQPIIDQISFQQAKLNPDWWKAMQEEFDALITHHIWELVELKVTNFTLDLQSKTRVRPHTNSSES